MRDLAQNSKSRRVREQARKELRDRGLISEEPKPEPGADTDFAEARESGPPILCRRRAPEKRRSCLCYNSGSFVSREEG